MAFLKSQNFPRTSQNSHSSLGIQWLEKRKEILTHSLLPGMCSCSQADNWQPSERSSTPFLLLSLLPLSPSPPSWA